MAKTITRAHVNSPISGVSVNNLPLDLVNFADYAKAITQSSGKTKEVLLRSLNAAIGLTDSWVYSITEVDNIYKGSGIDAALQSPIKKGYKLLISHQTSRVVTMSEDPSYQKVLFSRDHTVKLVPADPDYTVAMAKEDLQILSAGYFSTGTVTTDFLNQALRGNLVQTGVKG